MKVNETNAIKANHVAKEFSLVRLAIPAVRDVSLTIKKGEMVSITGPSGSGKSTLLGLLGGLDIPTSGDIEICGLNIGVMKERDLTRIRNEKIGFVFQFFNLIPTMTAIDNVALPAQFAPSRDGKPEDRARDLLTSLGLASRLHHLPRQLSGGEQQRVAIARALVNKPQILLCDEPTGNLDSKAGKIVIDTLLNIHREQNTTILIVTHDQDIASMADRTVRLLDGKIYA